MRVVLFIVEKMGYYMAKKMSDFTGNKQL